MTFPEPLVEVGYVASDALFVGVDRWPHMAGVAQDKTAHNVHKVEDVSP